MQSLSQRGTETMPSLVRLLLPFLAVFWGLVVGYSVPAAAAEPDSGLLTYPGFNLTVPPAGLSPGWSRFAHEGEYTVAIEPGSGPAGGPCLKVDGRATGTGGRAGALQRTGTITAPKVLQLRVQTKGEGGRRSLLVQFFKATDPGAIVATASAAIPGNDPAWREFTAELRVPPALRGTPITALVLLYLHGTGACWWDRVEVQALDHIPVRLEDRASDPRLIRPHPPDGGSVRQNPPDFRWRPEQAESYTLELCQKADFLGPSLQTYAGLRLNCFNPPQRLAPGTWFWRYRAANEDGETSDWGTTRSLVLAPDALPFVLPTAVGADLVAPGHPRLYVRRDGLEAFRRRREAEASVWWAAFEPGLERRLQTAPAAEPVGADLTKLGKPIDLDYFKVDAELRQASSQVTDGLWTLAFAYLITGERRYAEGAKRYLLHVSRWDTAGATSFASNDQVFRDIAIKAAMAYDWLYDTLSPDERDLVQNHLRARGRVLFERYAAPERGILNYPYDSHGQSNIGYLGLVALAVAGDLPEASAWLDYVIKVYANSFPPWGGDDGGWSQGVTYWKWSCFFSLQFVDALRSATGIDLYQKPWFRENGWFKLYFQPPWCSFSHFGDTGPSGVDAADANNLAHYAAVYGSPEFRWYADGIGAPPDASPYGYFFYDQTVPARPPLAAPQARHSADIGWGAMHSALYRPDDVMLFAKASPYGSYSHSHADQNSFVLYAFGEALAIDSGYYPWYGSAHHLEWAQQSRAHNTILVNGGGQPIQDLTAAGQSIAFHGGSAFSYWQGEAAGAYAGKLTRFRRHILHLPPNRFVIFDDLEAAQPARFQWLLHSLEAAEIVPAERAVRLHRGQARLAVRHLLPTDLAQSQTDQFSVPPESRGGTYPNQWHYTAETSAETTTARFLTLLQAFTEPAAALATAEAVPSLTATGVRLASPDRRLTAAFATDPAATTTLDDLAFTGLAAACEVRTDTPQDAPAVVTRYLLVHGRTLRLGGKTLVDADLPLSVSVGRLGRAVRGEVTAAHSLTVSLHLPEAPGTVETAGTWTFDAVTGLLRLRLEAGSHTFVARPAGPPESPMDVALSLGASPARTAWNSGESANLTQVAWGDFAAAPGVYRALREGVGRAWVNRQEVTAGGEVLLGARNDLLAERETSPAAEPPLRLSLRPLYTADEAIEQSFLPDDEARLSRALRIEAESYVEGIRGTPSIYSHRPFLSGGKGVATPATIGVGARWRIEVPAAGRYRLVLKVATHEPAAVRALRVDGQGLPADAQPIRIPSTGGFGAIPAEWRHVLVCAAGGQPAEIALTAGSHTLELIGVVGALNLDYLLLLPR